MTDTPASEESQDFEITVTAEDCVEFQRLDVYMTARLPQFSRSTIKRLFEAEDVSSETVTLKLNKMPPVGTVIQIEVPPPIPSDLQAENIPLNILFEDAHLLIINKPAGLVVHPAPGHYTGTLVNAVLFHCPDLKGIGAEKRPGIVHRLDMGTSGVMVVAKDQATHEGLVTLFSTHDIDRKYEALIMGNPNGSSGMITSLIGRHPTNRLKMSSDVKIGKKATTHWKTIHRYDTCTHIELKLETGRTHQIRVHTAQNMKCAVVSDPLYGSSANMKKLPEQIRNILQDYPYQLLHAKELGFVHPITKEKLHFSAPPPEIFQSVLNAL